MHEPPYPPHPTPSPHRQTEKQTGTDTDTDTHRQTDRHTHAYTRTHQGGMGHLFDEKLLFGALDVGLELRYFAGLHTILVQDRSLFKIVQGSRGSALEPSPCTKPSQLKSLNL